MKPAKFSGYHSTALLLRWAVEFKYTEISELRQQANGRWDMSYQLDHDQKPLQQADVFLLLNNIRKAKHMNAAPTLPHCWNPNCDRHTMQPTGKTHSTYVYVKCPVCNANMLWPQSALKDVPVRSIRTRYKNTPFKYDNSGNKTHRWHRGRGAWIELNK